MSRKGKKILAGFLSATTVFSLTACSGEKEAEKSSAETTEEVVEGGDYAFAPYKDELVITLGRLASQHTQSSMYEGDTFENNPYTRYVKEKLNISFEDVIEADGDDYKKQISLAIASGELPDMFTVTDYNTLLELVENDLIYDMTELYDKYICDYVKGVYDSFDGRCLEMATFDGKLMALPGSNPDNGVPLLCWVRKDWLEQLNFNPDEDGDLCITMEELEETAKMFMEADLSGQGTLGLAFADNVGDAMPIYELMGGHADKWVKNEDGSVQWSTFADDSVKKAWEKMNQWFEEGILDPQFGTRTGEDIDSLLINNQLGICFGPWHTPDWRLTHVKDANPDAEYVAYTLKDENGVVNTYHENAAGSFVVVNKEFEHPEAAVKILNVIFGDLATATEETAPEVIQFVKDGGDNFCRPFQIEVTPYESTQTYYTDHMAVMNKEITPDQATTAENRTTSAAMLQYLENPEGPADEVSAGWKAYNSRIVGCSAAVGALQKNDNANWLSPMYPPTLPVMAQKMTTLDTLELQAYIKIVTGEEPISYFDEFEEEWLANGGTEIIEELETYYQN
ncbi:MAG: extracellular solute-binding protein [Clostridiales bacterium]|nr:extracellular solute-binding protein [Clostridiales bacterium]